MNPHDDANVADSSSNARSPPEGFSVESSSSSATSKISIPSYTKILVPHDGKEASDKALGQAIYLSNLSGAEIVILCIIQDVEKFEGTSVDISQNKITHNQNSFELDIKGELVNIMESKIKQCTEAGSKNKISYGIRTGHVVHEIVKACQETDYDLVIMATTHFDSWLHSIFSETRKIISNIRTPVLIIH
jgi:nucleotide-binding universal stress UspA family protein